MNDKWLILSMHVAAYTLSILQHANTHTPIDAEAHTDLQLLLDGAWYLSPAAVWIMCVKSEVPTAEKHNFIFFFSSPQQ